MNGGFGYKKLLDSLLPTTLSQGYIPSPLQHKELLLSELRKLDRRRRQSADVFQRDREFDTAVTGEGSRISGENCCG